MPKQKPPHEGMQTPWGTAQTVTQIGAHVYFVSTASHGGVKLPAQLNRQIPDYLRRASGWYEEDCDWAIPFACLPPATWFPEQISRGRNALDTLRDWYPDEYERFTGQVIAPGQSHSRDRDVFMKTHAEDLVVISAFGDWHAKVPSGFVGVIATIGGLRPHGAAERCFLIPTAEYEALREYGFVVDATKYEEIPSLP